MLVGLGLQALADTEAAAGSCAEPSLHAHLAAAFAPAQSLGRGTAPQIERHRQQASCAAAEALSPNCQGSSGST